jgi:hypothetical protein
MKRAFLSFLMLLPLAIAAGENNYFNGTLEQAQAAAKSQNKMLVVKFYADW